jgi:SAM-dependent methyltransferase
MGVKSRLRFPWTRDGDLPIPPLELRELVGPTDPAVFDNPGGDLVLPGLPPEAFSSVLDFGCGCGRLARQLIQQHPQPETYLGLDLHRGMIEWCRQNLAPQAAGFTFEHHDVYNLSFNPEAPPDRRTLHFPAEDHTFRLVIAWSVFTHLLEEQIPFYLHEIARVLRPDGELMSTWFLFEKSGFPMMQDFQNCLYINHVDATNAVIADRDWLLGKCREAGLAVVEARPPEIRGFQWVLRMKPAGTEPEVEIPRDEAPTGLARPPLVRPGAASLGLDESGGGTNALPTGGLWTR